MNDWVFCRSTNLCVQRVVVGGHSRKISPQAVQPIQLPFLPRSVNRHSGEIKKARPRRAKPASAW